MTREQFDHLVREVETGVGRHPAALRRRVFQLALLGYAGLLFWLIIIAAIAAALFVASFWFAWDGRILCWFAGGAILFVGGWAALKQLLVKLPPEKGRVVTRAEVPELFAVLDELQRALQTVPFHEVIIGDDCNAYVSHRPRLGVLGWSRNYLLLGLPLLDGLSRDEMRAVLAHEFTHLSRHHGRFTHWLYRLRRSWEGIFAQLSRNRAQREANGVAFVSRFVDWFWPKFNAHAFVLSRAHEYEADAQAAALAGRAALASALVRLKFLARQLDENTWPEIWQLANEQPSPPADVFRRLRDALQTGPVEPQRSRWLAEAFLTKTTNSDTHPCLTERLTALGVNVSDCQVAAVATAASPSAAESLLGQRLDTIRADVHAHWVQETEKNWRERHARAGALSHRLASLHQAVPDPSADADSLWDQAQVLLDLKGDQKLEPLLRQILGLRPDHAAANFYLGRLLLDAGHGEGERYLERVIAEDEAVLPQACAILREHHRRQGRLEKLRAVEARLDRYEKDLAASRQERSEFTERDTLIPHGLDERTLQTVRTVLAAEPQLARAELAQKQMRLFPKQRFFILCVHRVSAWHRLPNADADRALAQRLSRAVQLPGRVLVIPASGRYRAVARKFRYLPGTEIHRATPSAPVSHLQF